MAPTAILITVPLGLLLYLLFIRPSIAKKQKAPLPPGPPPKPLIGNLRDLPSPDQKNWVHFLQHRDLYGPISSLTVFGQTIVILNDARVAFDLLEKRSNIYSSRPRMVFAGEMVGWEHILAMQPYSDMFRAYRKAMHRVLGTKNVIAQFNELQDVEARRFLLRVLEKPGDLVQHIRTETGAVILKIAYGYDIEPHGKDPLVALANESLANFAVAGTPGAWIVDTIPFMKYLPSWFPGTGFKRTAASWKQTLLTTIEKPYRLVLKQLESGKYPDSYLSNLLEETKGRPLSADEEQVIKWTAGSLYTGGADTTVSTLSCFFLAMALYPDVQRKAQEELDTVLGSAKLPTFGDRARLPYIEAIVKEALRWHPVAPMGIPHMSTEDDIYEGYLIPKNSLIMPNIWAFTHDASHYKDPATFNPSRFLGDTPEPDPSTLTFGFGRRICPGRLLADSSIFLTIAQSLAVFEISSAGEDAAKAEFLPGVISHPVPYRLDIRPRSKGHEDLVKRIAAESPFGEGGAKELEEIVV
ncbi:protein CYP620E1 [Aspergillus nidulans FGSC A4]|uniref:Cytochrome P450, putative (Eurofung) n=1 Tax=Emericella nidulans (strain FGSC A4 / ATCC 38163 / CBS 112.46 / NRRL 194 / M139) TaxID=227321 RepID=C8VN98_EMENI|nr:protein CYP620E1 [Aspergillus nidulans FGSC A4]CBF85201.1 TPA: cytochrome P450, putative (Eurofung) [Aspergillus nidulans FGSC A4]